MADPLELVTKLMALALNNPNAEEARSQYWGYDPPQPFKSPGEK